MFEELTEIQARQKLLEFVAEYTRAYHGKKGYVEGDRIPYASRVYDETEMVNLVDSALEFWLTSGRYTAEFEKRFAKKLGAAHCAAVNSGSSANLLAFMALTSPLLGKKAICPGDEIITVAASFPTTVSPIVQYGAVPVFVDITIPQYNIDTDALEAARSEKTKAIMLAHTLGNPFDIEKVKQFSDKYDLWLIEDNCDSLGATYTLNGVTKPTGTFGHIGTSSFYPAHHMTMGEGGAVYTNDSLLAKIILSMRDWGRDCMCAPGQDNLCGHRFDGQYGQLPKGYDHKYVYSHFGYNLKITDLQAAIGVAQLDKLDGFIQRRRYNFSRLHTALQDMQEHLILPEAAPSSEPSWFGFMLTCRQRGMREKVVRYLEEKGIQTRTLFAGNLTKQPCFDDFREKGQGYRIVNTLHNTDRIMQDTFWLGVYPGMTDMMIDVMAREIKTAFE